MPGRIIRVRKMREQEQDGDLLAVTAAAQILGASLVETLDTKGTDGSNVHLGGPDTITGYFGGIGQPNAHPLAWIDEVLYYYTTYGVREVLNINPGTVLLGYLLYRLGVNVEVQDLRLHGERQPLLGALDSAHGPALRPPDGSTSLIGFNLSNSIDARHLELAGDIRRTLGLEDKVRIEHHITECYRHIVRSPTAAGTTCSTWRSAFPTSPPSTKEAIRRRKWRWNAPRTFWITSGTNRRSSRAAICRFWKSTTSANTTR